MTIDCSTIHSGLQVLCSLASFLDCSLFYSRCATGDSYIFTYFDISAYAVFHLRTSEFFCMSTPNWAFTEPIRLYFD
jgi:hypothetical protein